MYVFLSLQHFTPDIHPPPKQIIRFLAVFVLIPVFCTLIFVIINSRIYVIKKVKCYFPELVVFKVKDHINPAHFE